MCSFENGIFKDERRKKKKLQKVLDKRTEMWYNTEANKAEPPLSPVRKGRIYGSIQIRKQSILFLLCVRGGSFRTFFVGINRNGGV